MNTSAPSILCPVDFSDASRAALRYAAVLAEQVGARLIVLTVDDPLLASVAAQTGQVPSLAEESRRELRHLLQDTLVDAAPVARTTEIRVAIGKPAEEILRVAHDAGVDLIVMSSQGRTAVGKHFFGSTTERVLRATDAPVLVTPKAAPPVLALADVVRHVHRIVVPVDLTAASPHQARVAARIAKGLAVPLIVTHVLEPVTVPPRIRMAIAGMDAERRTDTDGRLLSLVESSAPDAVVETLVLMGDPAEEIVKLADARNAGLVVMGLHSSGLFGPRMGSVTYRVLCMTRALVLALPPVVEGTARDAEHIDRRVTCPE